MHRHQDDAGAWMAWHRDVWFDRAYHFAAPVGGREKIEGDPLFNADSLRLDSSFFRWAIRGTDVTLYPSSSAVYGTVFQSRGTAVPLDEGFFDPRETHWPAPDEMYGFTKLAGEVLAWKSAAYGLNSLCLRPFSGYGVGQSMEYPVPSICARAKAREDPLLVWGSGMQVRDFVYISDLVAATERRLEAGVDGYQVLNVGSGSGTTFNELARLAAEIVGYEPRIMNDAAKPQGVDSRVATVQRLSRYYRPVVSLREGLTRILESL
jgi:GDP-L-fucose synthase